MTGKLLFPILKFLRKYYIAAVKRPLLTAKIRLLAGAVGRSLTVSGNSLVTKNTFLGNNVSFNGMHITPGGKVTIGDNFHSGPGCEIIAQNHRYDSGRLIPYDEEYEYKAVVIEDNVWFGNRVTVLPGVRIGEGAVIQAGSVVVSDIPRCGVAGGHPAKVFKYRDIEHYERLKNEAKFC